MAELDRILGEAQETHRQMQQAVKTSGDRAVRDIVRLRTRFATLVAEMMGSIKADSRLQAKPDVAREFEAKFFEMRQALAQLGWSVAVDRAAPGAESVHLMVSRNRGGFVFAGFSPDPEAVLRLRTPLGAPVLPGRRTRLEGGALCWAVWHDFHEECRVFVEQDAGDVSLNPVPARHALYRRRLLLTGLENATVRFFPERGCEGHTSALVNPDMRYCIVGDPCEQSWIDTPWGRCLEMRGVTGHATFAWARDDAVEPVKPGANGCRRSDA